MPQINLNQMEFSWIQFGKRMQQPHFSASKKWKILMVAGFLGMTHLSIIHWQNRFRQIRDGPLIWETAVEEFLMTF